MEMMDIRAMKTCRALSWISWIPACSETCLFLLLAFEPPYPEVSPCQNPAPAHGVMVRGRLVKGSDQYSQSRQTSVQRDIDPQYATIDQLTKITDTMASLWDAILGLGQRIDGHQAPSVPIQGTTPHDSSTPPPPPASGPTIQSDYIVHHHTTTQFSQPHRHLMSFPQTDFGSLVQALYGIEQGIARGLWASSFPSNSKGKKLRSGSRPSDVGTINMTGHRSPRYPYSQRQFLDTPYQMIQLLRGHLYSSINSIEHRLHRGRLGHRVPSFLLDNGSALNVCPLVTTIALGFSPSDFEPSTQTFRAYDGTQRTVLGTLTTHVMIGSVRYSILFQVLRIQTSFNMLLDHPGFMRRVLYHIPFIRSQCYGSVIVRMTCNLTGFTFNEVQVVSLEDDSRDMAPMSFDQYNNTLVLIDHDIPYGLGYTPSEEDTQHMVRLRRDRVRAGLSEVPFDYPLRPYTFQLADYFTRGSKHAPTQRDLSSETTEPPEAMIVASPSPDRASVFSMCFPKEIPDYDLPMDLGDGSDGVILPDTHMDEMDMIGTGRILDTTPHGPILLLTCLEFL
ncbi:hypothetical protein CK203_100422 [Vitis vinifera]|uniref:Uncharacterized protein n=1 Tax=Vitis vinifera TaxID=29760 RepID=A0A438CJ65_VITVI|nr:hypothetical protein CK203_100422 [Vitis vinifera]